MTKFMEEVRTFYNTRSLNKGRKDKFDLHLDGMAERLMAIDEIVKNNKYTACYDLQSDLRLILEGED